MHRNRNALIVITTPSIIPRCFLYWSENAVLISMESCKFTLLDPSQVLLKYPLSRFFRVYLSHLIIALPDDGRKVGLELSKSFLVLASSFFTRV